jgi:hypothetical protein
MSQTSQQDRPDLSPTLWAGVDDVCLRFEAAWQEGQRPAIDAYLADTPEPARSVLLRELLGLELAYRRRRGESPTRLEYEQLFPQQVDLIQRAFREESLSTKHGPPAQAGQAGNAPGARTVDLLSADAPAPDQHQYIGRYRVERVLGEGGFGTVYLAHDDQLHRPVAIKVPHRYRVSQPRDAAAYLAEARILARLDHPNIVPVHDVGSTGDGLCYVVSKFIEGSDLAKKIQAARPSPAESAALLAAVALALDYAHRQGLVHRDVSQATS